MTFKISNFTRICNHNGGLESDETFTYISEWRYEPPTPTITVRRKSLTCTTWIPIYLDTCSEDVKPRAHSRRFIQEISDRLEISYKQLVADEQMIILIAKINLFAECLIPDIITHMKTLI